MAKKHVNITQVCSEIFAGGDAPKDRMSTQLTSEYKVPVYSNGEDNDGLYGYTDFARVTSPSITVSARGTIGYTSIRNEPFVPIVRLITITPIPEIVDIRYLYYVIKNYNFKGSGTSIPQLTVPMLKTYKFPLPSLDEQRSIAAVLDKVSGLIAKRREQLDKLDELVKARFVEMFGDCKTNPQGWEACYLEEIAEVGSSRRVFVEELKDEGIPFYRGTEVGALAEGMTITPELFITEEHYKDLCEMTGKPQKGDLLMPSICPDGRIWLVDTEDPFYFKDGRVLWVHGISDKFDPVFLLYTLKDRIMTDYSSIASGTTFAELKIFALKRCQVFNAPIELQKKFSAFISKINRSKLTIQKSLDKLEVLKKSLMQQYFG